MLKTRFFSLFLAVVMMLTYCFGLTTTNVAAISSVSEIASLASISPGQTKKVEIKEVGGSVALKFTPTQSGKYIFYSVSTEDPMVCLYDGNLNFLGEDDDGRGVDRDFKIEYNMTAGVTYVFEMSFWDDTVGSFDVFLVKAAAAQSISISQGDNIKGYIKDTINLTVDFAPEGCTEEAVNWTTSNTAVATVDSGFVTFLKAGTAIITATSATGLKDTCTLTVLDYSTISVNTEKTVEITANRDYDSVYFTPTSSGTYAFSSNSTGDTYGAILSADYKELATDDNNGKDKNFRVECYLTAGTKYILKSEYVGITTGSFKVKVEKVVKATSISIAQGTSISGAVGYSDKLTVNFAPSNYITETITWKSSDSTKVSVADDGTISFLNEGTVTITATSQNGLTATCKVTVTGYADITEGVEKVVSNTVNNGKVLYKFVPVYTGPYAFYSYDSDFDTYGGIYDSSMNELAFNDDASEDNLDFYVTYRLIAGQTYYLEASPYYAENVGSYTVQIKSLGTASSMIIEQGNTLTGYTDDCYYLTVKFYPENASSEEVVWKSNKESVVEVSSDGRLDLIAEGTAVITATSQSGLTATCTVTVKKRNAATSIVIGNGSTIKGIVGGSDSLWYEFLPSDCEKESVTWSSSNESVATIDANGTVSFLKEGTAIITATSKNGLKATCTVVIESIPNPTAISITYEGSLTGFIGETISLNVEYIPENCVQESVTWSSANKAVATVDSNGKVTFVGKGTTSITATSASGLTASVNVTVKEIKTISLNTAITLNTNDDNGNGLFSFTPTATGTYAFYSYNSNFDLCGYIYDSNMVLLKYDDDSGEGDNFRVQYELTAGTKYYFKSEVYSVSATGTYSVKVIKLVNATAISFAEGSSFTSYVGATKQFELIYTPFESIEAESITWTSSNTSVVAIDGNGLATFKAVGNATLTAELSSGLKATLSVVVENYPVLSKDQPFTVNIAEKSDGAYFYFTPSATGKYAFYSSSNYDTQGYIMDSNKNVLAENDDGAGGYNFKVVCDLTKGVKYIMHAKFLDSSDEGSVTVCVTEVLSVNKIEVVSKPVKTTYIKGFVYDYLDYSGLEIKATWSDGSTTNWIYNKDNMFIGKESVQFDASNIETDKKVNISCGGVSTYFTVTINTNPVSRIELVTGTKQTYIEACDGELFEYYDPSTDSYVEYFKYGGFKHNDAVIKIVYTNGTTKNVNVGSIVDGYEVVWSCDQETTQWKVATNNKSTVSYLGHTVTLPITVVANPVKSIELVSAPNKTYILGDLEYGVYDPFDGYLLMPHDLTGLKIIIRYSDGTSKTITDSDFSVDNYYDGYKYYLEYSDEAAAIGSFPVTFKYLGRTVSYNVNVVNSTVSSISVTKKPSVNIYDSSYKPLMYGLELSLIYTDSTSKTVVLTKDNVKYVYPYASDYLCYEVIIDGYRACIIPDKYYQETFNVYYLGRSCNFDLTYNEMSEISSITLENVTENAEGMIVNIQYDNNTSERLELSTSSCLYEITENGNVKGYAVTSKGLLYFEISTVESSSNVQYTVNILGKTIVVTGAKTEDMPGGFVDVGNDFVAHIVTNDNKLAIGLSGVCGVVEKADYTDTEQLYYFKRQTDGSYKIINVKTKQVLSLQNIASVGVGVEILPEALSSQRWYVHYESGKYILRAQNTNNLVIGLSNDKIQLVSFAGADLSNVLTVVKIRPADYNVPSVSVNGVLTDDQIDKINNILCNVSTECNAMTTSALNKKIAEYAAKAFELGVTETEAIALCINILFIGGESELGRVLSKTDAKSVDDIYSALLTDTGKQVGAYRVRNYNFYKNCKIAAL